MAKLTISDAARSCRVARSTLQRAIQTGRLSLDPDHRIDTAELLRAGYTLHAALQGEPRRTRHAALQDAAPHASSPLHDAAAPSVAEPIAMQLRTAFERENTLLRTALDAAAAREQAAQERERDYREHIARLTVMLSQAHQHNQRLLDLPRLPAIPPHSPQSAPGSTQPPAPRHQTPVAPQTPPGDPRGAMRKRIVALLQDHPEGLTPAEMRDLLGVERSLGDTCLGMLRYGLVQRVGRGRYVATATSTHHEP